MVVVPGAASAQAPAGDSVTGTAGDCLIPLIDNECFRPIEVLLDAHSGPSGENPTGTAELKAILGTNVIVDDKGPASCLAVSGHTAVVGYSGVAPTLIRVTDGGSATGQDSFDIAVQGGLSPPDCSVFPPPASGDTVFSFSGVNRSGDLVVTDAPPLPTSKDQCKNGGWRNFAGFKNEGACVSLAAAGGKKPPAGDASGGGAQ
jgi:hypothetical protein